MSEYNKLNDALRAEKRLYQNLTHIHTKSDRYGSCTQVFDRPSYLSVQ